MSVRCLKLHLRSLQPPEIYPFTGFQLPSFASYDFLYPLMALYIQVPTLERHTHTNYSVLTDPFKYLLLPPRSALGAASPRLMPRASSADVGARPHRKRRGVSRFLIPKWAPQGAHLPRLPTGWAARGGHLPTLSSVQAARRAARDRVQKLQPHSKSAWSGEYRCPPTQEQPQGKSIPA